MSFYAIKKCVLCRGAIFLLAGLSWITVSVVTVVFFIPSWKQHNVTSAYQVENYHLFFNDSCYHFNVSLVPLYPLHFIVFYQIYFRSNISNCYRYIILSNMIFLFQYLETRFDSLTVRLWGAFLFCVKCVS